MKKIYESPVAEIEMFNLPNSVMTASNGGIEDGDNEYEF